MSCGGEALLGGCGCGPGVNAHESYKGDWASGSARNYSMSARYVGQETPLPKTAMTRSYAAEKLYVGKALERVPERVYATELFAPRELPRTIDLVSEAKTAKTYDLTYDSKASISELSKLADVYDKQRVLESKIAEAFSAKTIDSMVNTWTN